MEHYANAVWRPGELRRRGRDVLHRSCSPAWLVVYAAMVVAVILETQRVGPPHGQIGCHDRSARHQEYRIGLLRWHRDSGRKTDGGSREEHARRMEGPQCPATVKAGTVPARQSGRARHDRPGEIPGNQRRPSFLAARFPAAEEGRRPDRSLRIASIVRVTGRAKGHDTGGGNAVAREDDVFSPFGSFDQG